MFFFLQLASILFIFINTELHSSTNEHPQCNGQYVMNVLKLL